MPTDRQSVVDVVTSYHRGITEDLEAVAADVEGNLADGDAADVGASIERLVMQIVGLVVAEEQYVLPQVREHGGGGAGDTAANLVEAQFTRHRELEHQLRRLEDLELSADLLAPVLAEVRERFADLTASVDADLLPVLAALPADRQAELGDDVLGAIEVAPTRPREFVVENAELNKIVSFASGWVDRWRDSWSRRGRGTDDVDV